MNIIVTGGAGFIGSAFIRHLIKHTTHQILNIDKLTYAADLASLNSIKNHNQYLFSQTDITDSKKLTEIFRQFKPDLVIHFAAETHVDRSISAPEVFIQTNIIGTFQLLQVSLDYWKKLNRSDQQTFRFVSISTDEVYGELTNNDSFFHENSIYAPNSPYSASKASADHLVRAWHKTYGLPTLITHSSNNYGPYQYPEKLIPHTILNALSGKPINVYGNGEQIRDWLFIQDHIDALMLIITKGKIGEIYNIGGDNELKNIFVVKKICDILDTLKPEKPNGINHYSELITFVQDRLGHDFRYAIDNSKIKKELGWFPKQNFEVGLQKTIQWYLQQSYRSD